MSQIPAQAPDGEYTADELSDYRDRYAKAIFPLVQFDGETLPANPEFNPASSTDPQTSGRSADPFKRR
jgi:hypothetical protein